MKSKPKTATKRKTSPSAPLNYHQKISLTSIIIIFFCLSIALWSIRQQHQLQLLKPVSDSHQINLTTDLPPVIVNTPFSGTITATSNNPNSQLILSLTNTPATIDIECTQHMEASFTDTCILTGSFAQAKPHQVLATVIDRNTGKQIQEWFTVQVTSLHTTDAPAWIKM